MKQEEPPKTESIEEIIKRSPCALHWQKVGVRPHHGVDILLGALRTKKSCGIGEFLDLLPLIDWCQEIGLSVIQLLPLNDSGLDLSPYNILSSCALNPVYLSLHALPYCEEMPDLKEFELLNHSQHVTYLEVLNRKLLWLKTYFAKAGPRVMKSNGYLDYTLKNQWVQSYSLFKVLKDLLGHSGLNYWPKELKNPSLAEFDTLLKEHKDEILFYSFLQYLCFLQMSQVKAHAETKQVLLMGDVPILISPDSVDVWRNPHIFDTTVAVGAPPDIYSKEGQYWGFPLFRWDVMKEDNFTWWRSRLHYMTNFYNMYRIDHAVGFFHMWAIPLERPPKEGKFIPEDPDLWEPQGKMAFEMMINASPLLPLAEDLGALTKETRQCLQSLGVCTTKVIRWERNWDGDKSFIPYSNYSPLSMTTVSTHDSEPLALWWKTAPKEAEAFARFKGWSYHPAKLSTAQHKEILWDSHHTPSLFHINLLQEYLTLFPELSWPKLEEERINVPGKILPSNWSYRYRPSLEEFIAHKGLRKLLQDLIK